MKSRLGLSDLLKKLLNDSVKYSAVTVFSTNHNANITERTTSMLQLEISVSTGSNKGFYCIWASPTLSKHNELRQR